MTADRRLLYNLRHVFITLFSQVFPKYYLSFRARKNYGDLKNFVEISIFSNIKDDRLSTVMFLGTPCARTSFTIIKTITKIVNKGRVLIRHSKLYINRTFLTFSINTLTFSNKCYGRITLDFL